MITLRKNTNTVIKDVLLRLSCEKSAHLAYKKVLAIFLDYQNRLSKPRYCTASEICSV